MNRKVPPTRVSEFFSFATAINTVPKRSCEALAIFPGQGELQRYRDGIDEWNSNFSLEHLLVAAENTRERTAIPQNLESLRSIVGLRRCENVHYGVHADHTLDQAIWLCEKFEQLAVKSCMLYTTPFFLPRAFATVVKQLIKRGMSIPVIPVPVRSAPCDIVPEANVPGWDMFAGEAERIVRYQEKGDVASFTELRMYINWLWQDLS